MPLRNRLEQLWIGSADATPAWRYGVAITVTLAAALLRLGLNPLWGTGFPMVLFFPATLFGALLGGIGPGLVSVALCATVAALFIEPMSSLGDFAGVAIYALADSAVAWIGAAHRRAWLIVRRQASELHAHDARLDSETRLRLALDAAKLGAWDRRPQTGELIWDARCKEIFGLPPEAEITFKKFLDAVHPQDRDRLEAAIADFSRPDGPREIKIEYRAIGARDGKERWIASTGLALVAQGEVVRAVGVVQDITERKTTEEELRLASLVFNAASDALIVTDAEERILAVNPAFTQITGYSAPEVLGKTPRVLASGSHSASFYAGMWDKIAANDCWHGEIVDRRKSGELYPKWMSINAVRNAAGRVTHYVGLFADITDRKTSEEEIRNLAFFDSLTKLPNRKLLHDRLEQALAAGSRSMNLGALLFIDLDNFKTLNDTQGHDAGDLLLVEVAGRIKGCARKTDTVARLGGDEFVVALENVGESHDRVAARAGTVAHAILAAINEPYALRGHEHLCSASVGITLFSGEDSVEDLLRRADTAMYEAKRAGRGAVRFFDPAMQEVLEERSRLEAALRRALQRDEFRLHYQLQVDDERRPIGAEALLRWERPEGSVPPAQFIPVAEETGLILAIGRWALEAACAQVAAWKSHPAARALTVAINVSARHFREADFVEQVQAALERHDVAPARIKLELTESLLMHDLDDAIEKMNRLKSYGVGFAMDDFGIGYSSLCQLKALPLDQLKIDQSFVCGIAIDPEDAAIARTILSMGRSLRLETIAEGVETEQQMAFLLENGCKAFQGYLFGKPVPAAEFERGLAERLELAWPR